MNPRRGTKGGFSIIEVLVAAAIVVVGFGAAMALLVSIIKNTRLSKEQVIAANLAQEGIELVRYKRDYNTQSGIPGVSFNNELQGVRAVDYNDDVIPNDANLFGVEISSGGACPATPTEEFHLFNDTLNPIRSFYVHENNGTHSPSAFYRCIEITSCATTTECVKVLSKVYWRESSSAWRTIEIKDVLYDWQPQP